MFDRAAPAEQAKISLDGWKISDMTNTADATAPIANPHGTAMVSHGLVAGLRCHAPCTCGMTAVAENQVELSGMSRSAPMTRTRRALRRIISALPAARAWVAVHRHLIMRPGTPG